MLEVKDCSSVGLLKVCLILSGREPSIARMKPKLLTSSTGFQIFDKKE